MEGRDVALLLAGAVAGLISFRLMERFAGERPQVMKATSAPAQQSPPSNEEEKKEDAEEESGSESEDDEDDFPEPGTIKDNYTLMSGKFKMVWLLSGSWFTSAGPMRQYEFADGKRQNRCPMRTRHSRCV
jgi:hypothetical protein